MRATFESKIKYQTEYRKNMTKEQKEKYYKKRRIDNMTEEQKIKKREKDKIYGLKKYGINIKQYNQMLISQNNKCAICNMDFSDKIKICIDHNHKTKTVRQLLCAWCNTGIGYFKDNPDIIIKAYNYTIKWLEGENNV